MDESQTNQNPKSGYKQSIPPYMKAISGSFGEGVRALWKGMTPFATHLTFKYPLRMGSNAVLQSSFKDSTTGSLSNQGRVLAGFGAGVREALLIVSPFEIHEEGIFGLWAGAAPTVMRNGTNQAAMFTAKNAFDVILWKKHEGDQKVLQPWQSMISGFLAGTAGPVCTGPFDVVKTRPMAQSRDGGELKYKGMIHAIQTIYMPRKDFKLCGKDYCLDSCGYRPVKP
uniref:Uncharacterized protein n=1 Tax=Gossypium raimondii TaxID=29730 RepID=A0A0D2S671_GOSRA|nr:hypothetical protein B456_006G193400 [Gossypium raimondii]